MAGMFKKTKDFVKRHPIAAGYGASVAGTLGAAAIAKPMVRRAAARAMSTYPAAPSSFTKVKEAADKLYPHMKGNVDVKVDMQAMQGGGGAYTSGRLFKQMSRTSLQQAALKMIMRAVPGGRDALKQAENMRPTAMVSPANRPEFLAHELGHASLHTDPKRRVTSSVMAHSRPLSAEGTAFLGSVAAQPAISRMDVSDKTKRRLRMASVALPVAAAAPMLADEAIASMRGMKMLRAAGASPADLRGSRRELTKAFGSYAGVTGGQIGGAGLTAYGYRQRDRARRRK